MHTHTPPPLKRKWSITWLAKWQIHREDTPRATCILCVWLGNSPEFTPIISHHNQLFSDPCQPTEHIRKVGHWFYLLIGTNDQYNYRYIPVCRPSLVTEPFAVHWRPKQRRQSREEFMFVDVFILSSRLGPCYIVFGWLVWTVLIFVDFFSFSSSSSSSSWLLLLLF